MFLVQKHQIKVRFGVVVLVYPLLVPIHLAVEQSLPVSRPEIHKRMSICQYSAKVQRRNQVSFEYDVAIQVRFADSLLIHGSQRRNASPIVNRNSKLDWSGPDAGTRPVQI